MSNAPSRPTLALTAAALCAFAANSLLCRAALSRTALGAPEIDAATFTSVRIVSGALVLWTIVRVRRLRLTGAGWRGACALCAYALCFSFAYLRIPAGVGALILFGAVQVTMVGSVLVRGESVSTRQWLGLTLALGGLAWLNAPGADRPDALGAAWMALAGIAWGAYSLLGRGSAQPLANTAQAFLWGVPIVLAVSVLQLDELRATPRTLLLAAASGTLASGLGYTIWYTALRGLSTTNAAIAQLSVPVIAAVGGVVLLGEVVRPRLWTSAALVLGGIAIAVVARRR